MSRQLDLLVEERASRRHDALIRVVEYDLHNALQESGAVLSGFSVKFGEWECLITLRADLDGVQSVAFVGAEALGDCLLKCVRDARGDKLRWRQDSFAKK